MLIGYSFWGFLGAGIRDTPDGGRSHRRLLIDGLHDRGHTVVFLQADRDRTEAGLDLTTSYRWDVGLPEIDLLFLEWRWPIAGRNTTPCGQAGHTCDLHRQGQLLRHYVAAGTPILIWDKDRRLPATDPLRTTRRVVVCEPALYPTPGAVPLLFPVADTAIDAARPDELAARRRDLPLVYVGNQYDRDDAFDKYFVPAARRHRHLVAGKWSRTAPWPDCRFIGRIRFDEVGPLHQGALTTMLLLPPRYSRVGHMTQRLGEAVLAGCLPLTPTNIRGVDSFAPAALQVDSGAVAAQKIERLAALSGSSLHERLLTGCLQRLDRFRLSRQLDAFETATARLGLGNLL